MMHLYPADIKEKLEFDKIDDQLLAECLGDGGKNLVAEMNPSGSVDEVKSLLNETSEYLHSIERNDPIPLSNYMDISEEVYLLQKEGYVLSVESIKKLYFTIAIGMLLDQYFLTLQRQKLAPSIFATFKSHYLLDENINKEIDRVMDDEGNIRPDASEALSKIYRKIQSKEKEIISVYSKIIFQAKSKGLLTDSVESFRNGRRVLSLPVENKRKLSGVIHDESATGKTVFMEPDEAIVLNNDLFNLHTEKKKEIYKVLRDLCAILRPHALGFEKLYLGISKLDLIRSRSMITRKLEGIIPELSDSPMLKIINGYSPILKNKYKGSGRDVVPLTADVHPPNKIVVISGPNAGGKSVAMKTIGLLQLMVQCGIGVPVDPTSTFGVFTRLMVDIGDQQSIEDDLSTYSSHLANMKYFVEYADKRALFLIDEFGSGTDPKIGGAIAEAVLKQLHHSGASGVITTHYSNLKYFAFKTRGIVNASMEFDTQKMDPTYMLKVGKPGSSFAFEIATKTGLPKKVLQHARHKTGKNEKAIDELLLKLQEEQQETEFKMKNLLDKEDRLNKLIKNYENLHRELEYRRKKIKLSEKERKLTSLGRDNKEIQKLVNQVKAEEKERGLRELLKQQKEEKEKVKDEVSSLKEEVFYNSPVDVSKLKVGSYARLRTGTQTGKIVDLKNNMVQLEMGFLKMEVPLHELVPAGAPVEINSSVSINTSLGSSREGSKTKIDVRGYTPTDTREVVQELVDNALIYNINHLTIVHGRGNGVLRKVVHEKLKEYKEIKEVTHPEEAHGGKSITYVRL